MSDRTSMLRAEAERRLRVRSSMNEWARACELEPAKHHQLLNDTLDRVKRGELKRVMFFLPPGSAKSTYASVLFPPYFLAAEPNKCILTASYSYTLAESFGSRCRNLVELHKAELGYTLRPDTRSKGEWETTNGGRYFCAGVGAGIAGHRADLVVIDDPVGSIADADSKLYRDNLWNWFHFDLMPRLKPNASMAIIQTRWHPDDLAGRLLDPKINPKWAEWTVISLPFFAREGDALGRQPGEMLWPEWFKPEMFPENPRVAAALYQCSPMLEEGNFFKLPPECEYSQSELPALNSLTIYCSSDHALSKREDADKSCYLTAGMDTQGTLWILPNIVWSRLDSLQQVNTMFDVIKTHHPLFWWAGRDHIETALGPFLKLKMWEEGVFSCLIPISPGKRDKRSRAQAIHGMISAGRVRFPRMASWWLDAKDQMLKFTGVDDAHDDFVDALAVLGQGVLEMKRPFIPKKKEVETFNGFRPTFKWLAETEQRSEERLIRV